MHVPHGGLMRIRPGIVAKSVFPDAPIAVDPDQRIALGKIVQLSAAVHVARWNCWHVGCVPNTGCRVVGVDCRGTIKFVVEFAVSRSGKVIIRM